MPLTPEQRNNVERALSLLEFIRTLCPDIPRLPEIIDRLNWVVDNDHLFFDTEEVTNQDASSPAITVNKEDTYVLEDFGQRSMYWNRHRDVRDLVHFTVTLVHEMFHHLCSSHPTTYTETADLLQQILNCIENHRDRFDDRYEFSEQLVDALRDQMNEERRLGGTDGEEEGGKGSRSGDKRCFIATAVYCTEGPEIRTLRRFRDEFMVVNQLGRKCLKLYYLLSSPLADYLLHRGLAKIIVGTLLYPVVLLCTLVLRFRYGKSSSPKDRHTTTQSLH